jgi:hypothetical protein
VEIAAAPHNMGKSRSWLGAEIGNYGACPSQKVVALVSSSLWPVECQVNFELI